MTKPWNNTRVAATLGIRYPLIQGALGGFPAQRLAAAVSNFGGLGSFGAHGLTPQAIGDTVAEIRSLTTKPFAVNLWVSTEDPGAASFDSNAFDRALSHIAPFIDRVKGEQPSFWPYTRTRFEEQARVLLDARVPVFSFIYGVPPAEILDEARRQGIVTMGTATTPDEAATLEQAGVDVVIASGFEAGGHRGSFLRSSEDSLTGSMSLIPQVVDRVRVPVVAAGGVADARGVAAAFALGAEGVQMGTVFLACEESGAPQVHREVILSGKAGHTGLTRGFTGRLARGVHNELLEHLNRPGTDTLPYPLQRTLMRSLAIPAQKEGAADLLALWAGQSANLSHTRNVNQLLENLVAGAAHRLGGPILTEPSDDLSKP